MHSTAYKILPYDKLLRRVKLPPYADDAMEFIKTLPNGKKVVARFAFRPHPVKDKDGLSVNIMELVKSLNFLFNAVTHLAIFVTSKQCTNLGLTTEHNPLSNDPDDPLFSHALIKGLDGRKDLQASLSEKCTIIE
ncbi:MAG: hypothetical protein ABII90_04535 [Bacteroidota bacterium]